MTCRCWFSNFRVGISCIEIMKFALKTLLAFVDKTGYKNEQTGLLTHADYVIYKCLDTVTDMQRLRHGLLWNAHAAPFYPKNAFKSQGNSNTSESSPLSNAHEDIARNSDIEEK